VHIANLAADVGFIRLDFAGQFFNRAGLQSYPPRPKRSPRSAEDRESSPNVEFDRPPVPPKPTPTRLSLGVRAGISLVLFGCPRLADPMNERRAPSACHPAE
jgi:hypothetical protein